MPEVAPIRFNPFPGLRPFQMDEEHLFFGREQQRKELIALLREHRFVTVLGASGSGKSSLVRAGLLPALYGGVMTQAGSHWHIAILRPGGSPIANLAAALLDTELWEDHPELSSLDLETTLNRSALGLVEAVRQGRLPEAHNLLVVVDQFEELFRFSQSQSERSTRDEAAAFVNLLLEATRPTGLSLYVVLTMRSDFFGDCAQFEDLAEAINKGEYLVPRLTREQKKQAIEGPVKVGGASISPRLVQLLLSDVGDDPDQLPVLQHALMRTWDRWEHETQTSRRPLDLEDYEGIGGIREALSRHADEVYAGLPDDRHRWVAVRLFQTLTERGADNRGVRRPTRLGRLGAIAGATGEETQTVVEAFRRSGRTFLMPPESTRLEADTVVDISHESLMRVWQRLRVWVEEEAQSARIYRRLADSAVLHRDGKAGLYHDPDLQIALSWRDQSQPTAAWAERYHEGFDLAMGFLDESARASRAEEEAREAARRHELEQARALAEAECQRAAAQTLFAARLRWLVRGLGIVAMVALTAFLMALVARQQARLSQQSAEDQARFAEQQRGQATLAKDQAQTLAGQLKSTLTRADFATAGEQLNAGQTDPALAYMARSLRTDSNFWPAPFLAKVVLSEKAFPTRPPPILRHDEPIQWWSINETKDAIWTVDIQGLGFLWEATTGRRIAPLAEGKKVGRVRFTRDGRRVFAAVTDDQILRGWEAATGEPATPEIRPPPGFGDYVLSPSTNLGRLLAVQNGDGSLAVWDTATAEPTAARIQTDGRVTHLGFTPDGQWVFGAFDDGVLGLWNPRTGEPRRSPIRHRVGVNEVDFSPDSRFLVMLARGRQLVQWWDLESGEESSQQAEFEFGIQGLAFHPARPELALVGSRPKNQGQEFGFEAFTYNLATGARLSEIHEDKLNQWQFADYDESRQTLPSWVIAAVVDQRRLKIWDLAGDQPISELPLQESPIASFAFSPEAGRVAVVTEDANVRLWDVFTAKPATDPLKHEQTPFPPFFSGEGEKLLTFNRADHAYRVWDARTGQQLFQPQELSPGFYSENHPSRDRAQMLILNQGSRELADGREKIDVGEVAILDTQTAHSLATPLRMGGQVRFVTYDSAGARFLSGETRGDPAYAVLWEATSLARIQQFEHPNALQYGAFSPDGTKIVTACWDRVARVWDLASGEVRLKLDMGGPPQSARFSPSGDFILTSTFDGKVQVWDAVTGAARFEALQHGDRIDEPVFGPDGSWFLTGSIDSNLRVVDTRSGRLLGVPVTAGFPLSAVGASPDGQTLFGVCFGQTASAWDRATRELIHTMPLSANYTAVAFQPGGELVLSAGGAHPNDPRGFAYLWNWREGRLHAEPLSTKGQASAVGFSPDGRMATVATSRGTLTLWDADSGKRLMERSDHTGHIFALAFRPDNRQLITASVDQTLQVVDLPVTAGPVPEWFASLVEGAAGRHLTDAGALEHLPVESLEGVRRRLEDSAVPDGSNDWARWFLSDRRTRPITPSSPRDPARQVADWLHAGGMTNLFRALQLEPNNGLVYARVGYELARDPGQKDLPAQATNHWHRMALWYSNQATNLAPASAEVWALRAATAFAGGRVEAAGEAADRALACCASDPNALLLKALSVAEAGEPERAYGLYVKALDATPLNEHDVAWFNRPDPPFLIGGLAAWSDALKHTPLDLARAGRGRLDDSTDRTPQKVWEARWMTRRAVELAPHAADVARLRSEVLFERTETAEAMEAFKRSVDLTPDGTPTWADVGYFLRSRANLLERLERYDEAQAVFLKDGIPGRSPGAHLEQVDLGPFFNSSLLEDPHRPAGGRPFDESLTWRNLRPGLHVLGGVAFELRGEIFLNGTGIRRDSAKKYPAQVAGIPIHAKSLWLHFLHNSSYFTLQTNLVVGRYRLHFADGTSRDFPLVNGEHVQDWVSARDTVPRRSRLVYEEVHGESHKKICLTTWENPRPDVEIVSLDFISSMTPALPFLLAITLENPLDEAALEQLPAIDLARDAVRRVTWTEGLGGAGQAYAQRLTRLAMDRDPGNPEVQRARAFVLSRTEPTPEAEAIVGALLSRDAGDARAWALKGGLAARAGRSEEARKAYQQSIDLLSGPETFDGEDRQAAIVEASEWNERTEGRLAAREFLVRQNIPPRDPGAQPAQVDLAGHYNGALNEAWFRRADGNSFPAALKTMPRGRVTLQGLGFDVRGVIQLNDRQRRSLHTYPNAASGIPVGVRADQLHFLHATSFGERFGTVVARYGIHYANGETREFPVEYGRHILDFYVGAGQPVEANVAWRGLKTSGPGYDNVIVLSSWDNPLPDVEIERIDFVSELTDCQPFLIAVSAEQFLSPEERKAVPPAALAERAFHLVNPWLEPSDRVTTYARSLLEEALARGGADPSTLEWAARAEVQLGAYEPALAHTVAARQLRPERSELGRMQSSLLLKLGRGAEADDLKPQIRQLELRERIPARDPSTPAQCIDLSVQYNAALGEGVHANALEPEPLHDRYSHLATGLRQLNGVPFDVRGLVHLNGKKFDALGTRLTFPIRMTGIQVARSGGRLHFLHGAGWGSFEPDGTEVAHYVVHFKDGTVERVPVRIGREVREWWLNFGQPAGISAGQLACRVPSGVGADHELGLYQFQWDNPHPEKTIETIDFVSLMTDVAPFLVAITVE